MELYRLSAEPHVGHHVPFWLLSLVSYAGPSITVRNNWLTFLPSSEWAGLVFNLPCPNNRWIRVLLGSWRDADPRLHVALWFDPLSTSVLFRIMKRPILSYVKSDWCSTCVVRLSSEPFICVSLPSCWFCTPGWTASTQPFDCIFHSCIFSSCASKWPLLTLVSSNTHWALHSWSVTLPAPS